MDLLKMHACVVLENKMLKKVSELRKIDDREETEKEKLKKEILKLSTEVNIEHARLGRRE